LSLNVSVSQDVLLEAPAAGNYTVAVRAHAVPGPGPQCFALVVTGAFADAGRVAELACPAGCSGRGACVRGECQCDGLWTGPGCDAAIPLLESGTRLLDEVVRHDAWNLYAIDLGAFPGGTFALSFERTSSVGDPDVYVNRGAPPSFKTTARACAPPPFFGLPGPPPSPPPY